MGPREKALRDKESAHVPRYAGDDFFDDWDNQEQLELALLRDALEEALNGWEYAAGYKGEFLMKKHGDAEDIARLRKVLEDADE